MRSSVQVPASDNRLSLKVCEKLCSDVRQWPWQVIGYQCNAKRGCATNVETQLHSTGPEFEDPSWCAMYLWAGCTARLCVTAEQLYLEQG